MPWLKNEDKVESQKSAQGMKDAFCQIQHHLDIGAKAFRISNWQRMERPEFLYHVLLVNRYFKSSFNPHFSIINLILPSLVYR